MTGRQVRKENPANLKRASYATPYFLSIHLCSSLACVLLTAAPPAFITGLLQSRDSINIS